METLQRIIDAEAEAAAILRRADSLRAGQAERVKAGKEALLSRCNTEAEAAIAKAEYEAQQRANASVAELSVGTEERLRSLQASFARDKTGYVDRLFRLSIGDDDGE